MASWSYVNTCDTDSDGVLPFPTGDGHRTSVHLSLNVSDDWNSQLSPIFTDVSVEWDA